MFTKKSILILLSVLFCLLLLSGTATATPPKAEISNDFTYQGRLSVDGLSADGTFDFKFRLYDGISSDVPLASVTIDGVTVTDGLFTVQLNFGSVFDGGMRYLEISVRPSGSADPYTVLDPRQQLTAAPYANYAVSAPWSGLTDIPPGFDDDVDNDTTYSAGTGLSLVGTQFNVSGVPWTELDGIPADFADGTDDNTTYSAGTGLSLIGTEFSVSSVPWSELTAIPAGFADGEDNDTTYTAGEGLALNGTVFKGKGTSYKNVIIVAKSGGDEATIQDALISIDDARADNPYLVYVAPGVYNEQVTMKEYVDIEGAGELRTKITYQGSTSTPLDATLVGANYAELRFLTVENTGGAEYAVAIANDSASPRLTHVTANASGGNQSHGVYNQNSNLMMTNVTASASGGDNAYGVSNQDSNFTMTNVTANASGGAISFGVFNQNSNLTMTNVTASASGGGVHYGIRNQAASGDLRFTLMVNNSQITGVTNTIYNVGFYDVFIGASQLSGGPVYRGDGTVTCIGVYDEDYTNTSFDACP